MTSEQDLINQLETMYDYLDFGYADYQDFEDEMVARIVAAGLDQDAEDQATTLVSSKKPLSSLFGSVEIDAIEQTIASASFSGGAAYLESLSKYYPRVGERIVANVVPDRTLVEAIETTVVELAQPANQTFPKVGQLAKGLGASGALLGLSYAAYEIYNSPNPGGEFVKQSTLMAVGYGASAFIVMAATPYLGLTAAAVLGTVAAGGIIYKMTVEWDNIVDDIVAAKASATSLSQTIDDIVGDYTSAIESAFTETGAAVADIVDAGQGWLDDLAGALPRLPLELPDWLDGPGGPLPLFGGLKDIASPLVLDLDGDGVELTTFNASTTSTFFDIDGDGFAEQTAWVAADDGMLVRDVGENGMIDDVTELFGSPSVDGFAKLALLDSNGDLIINQYDDAWGDLLIWQDINGDAISQAGELVTLASLDIVSIDLAGVTASSTTISGNPISHTSTFRYDDNSTAAIADVWFVHDNVNTAYAADYTLDVDAIFLPTLRGFGEVADLHIAMSENEDLLDLVSDFTTSWGFDAWQDSSGLDAEIANILYEWAGVTDGSPTVYRGTLDSRSLAFIEKYFGQQWSQILDAPGVLQAWYLQDIWLDILLHNKTAILLQAGAGSLFTGDAGYNAFSGEFEGSFDLDETAINSLVDYASASGVDAEEYWLEFARFVETTRGIDELTSVEEGWIDDAIYLSDNSLSWADIKDILYYEEGVNTITGTSASEAIYGIQDIDDIFAGDGNDVVYGDTGSDEIDGYYGNDTLYGEEGNDTLIGGYGDDILVGGEDDDSYNGGPGSDRFIYTSGRDYIVDSSGVDTIELPPGITLSDITIYHYETDDSMFISVDGLGDIEIYRFFYSSSYLVETLLFADSSTINLTTVASMSFYGTEGDDDMRGENNIDEVIFGFAGNDALWGYSGTDRLDGGVGNDTLNGGAGDDTYVASSGFDAINDGFADFNTLEIPTGYTLSDLQFIRNGNHVNVLITDLGQIQINNQATGSGFEIDQLYFAEDSSTVAWGDVVIEVRGGDGNDYLSGTSHDDILTGMAGNDTLQGGSGNDSYVFSTGSDIVYETGGAADRVLFWEGWSPEQVTVSRQITVGFDDLVIRDNNGNQMVIESYYDFPSGGGRIETIEFSDSTVWVWNVSSLSVEIFGTTGNDSISVSEASGNVFNPMGAMTTLRGLRVTICISTRLVSIRFMILAVQILLSSLVVSQSMTSALLLLVRV